MDTQSIHESHLKNKLYLGQVFWEVVTKDGKRLSSDGQVMAKATLVQALRGELKSNQSVAATKTYSACLEAQAVISLFVPEYE